jgi:hypothetical protein
VADPRTLGLKCVSIVFALCTLVIAWGGLPAFANDPNYGYSEVKYPGFNPEEPGHDEILGDVYGGTFVGSGIDLGDGLWTIFSNGLVTAYRVYDTDEEDEIIHVIYGDQTNVDQIWTDGTATVTAEAKYAAYTQSFGWNGGGLGTEYEELLTHEDVGNGSVEIFIDSEEQFLWGIQPYNYNYEWWSKNSYNGSGEDHMVTYYIDGASISGENVWMLFWEDLPSGDPWDQDYQDFVIEVRAVPEPGSILLFGLGAVALLRKRRA